MDVTGTINASMSKMARGMKIAILQSEKKKSTIICPECGAKTVIEMNYCGACGSCLSKEND